MGPFEKHVESLIGPPPNLRESMYTRFSAYIRGQGPFPLEGKIDNYDSMLMFVNYGTTPETVTPKLRQEADRIQSALRSGQTVDKGRAIISPRL